jgi:hypothetical protein
MLVLFSYNVIRGAAWVKRLVFVPKLSHLCVNCFATQNDGDTEDFQDAAEAADAASSPS